MLIISVASSMFIVNYTFRKHFISIFTNSEEIQAEGLKIFVVVLIVLFIDFFQTTMQGFIKALNMQQTAVYVNLITFYIIIIPSSYLLAF